MTEQETEQDELADTPCENCGVVTTNVTCSKSCYNVMKAEYALD